MNRPISKEKALYTRFCGKPRECSPRVTQRRG